MLQDVGLLLFAVLFLFGCYSHLTKHDAMVAYTISVLGDCPIKAQLGFLGGLPTGLYLGVTGVLVALHYVVGLYMAAGFLALAAVLFHRDFSEPHLYKNIALFGAALTFASHLN